MPMLDTDDSALWYALNRLMINYWAEVDQNGGDRAHEFYLPDALYAVCWYDPGSVPSGAVAQQGYQGPPERYFDLGYCETPGSVIVASSGWCQPEWTYLPNRHVLVVDRATLTVTTHGLESASEPVPAS